jgi:uncharacterized membrane protein (UPF0127 family)
LTAVSRKDRRVGFVRLAVTLASALAACAPGSDSPPPDDYSHLLAFDTAHVRVIGSDTSVLTVELAKTGEQRTMGLMERRVLPPDAGMLFLYDRVQPESSAFWMFRTRIPLDIAFVDSAGVIRTMQTMSPCQSVLAEGCPNYPAGAPYLAALEVNAGYFARKHLRVGDRLVLADTSVRRQAPR